MGKQEVKRYVEIRESISSDGLGIPCVSVYFSYCDKKVKTGSFCYNCQNPHMQEDGVGYNLTLTEILNIVRKKYDNLSNIYGECCVALIGGEPLAEINRGFSKAISEKYPTIIYTWRVIKDLIDDKIDISTYNRIVCGEYVEELTVEDYILGSSNQYVIDNELNKIIKYEGVELKYAIMDKS